MKQFYKDTKYYNALASRINDENWLMIFDIYIKTLPAIDNISMAGAIELTNKLINLKNNGFMVDGIEVCLITFQVKETKTVSVTPIITAVGLKKMFFSRGGTYLYYDVVYKDDVFDFTNIDGRSTFTHKYSLDNSLRINDNIIGIHVTYEINNEKYCYYVDKVSIEKIKNLKTNKFWVSWYKEMAIKTAIKSSMKRLPILDELFDDSIDDEHVIPTYYATDKKEQDTKLNEMNKLLSDD
jgi:hypothetical protein